MINANVLFHYKYVNIWFNQEMMKKRYCIISIRYFNRDNWQSQFKCPEQCASSPF